MSTTTSSVQTLTPAPSGPLETNIDIYLYFDRVYTSITIFFIFVVILMITYSSPFIPHVFAVYVIVMIVVYFYRNRHKSDVPPVDNLTPPPVLDKLSLHRDQVFHIPGNQYTYEDAKAVCKAFDSRLASYAEIENAYQNGADWCSYGWSADQNAFFPTQQAHYDLLQKVKGHEHDCGRVGINGGYMKNSNLKFGVNCFGKKPPISEIEEKYMAAYSPYPLTKEDLEFDKKVSSLKNNLQNILVSPFNSKNWNEPILTI